MSTIKIIIVDDHAILRKGLTSLLNAKKDLSVIGEAEDGKTAIALANKLHPDVIIMDLAMPGMDGVETTRRIVSQIPGAKILILTTFGTSDGIARALDAGALGAVMKNVELSGLLDAVYATAAGQRFISDDIQQILRQDPPLPALSPRQLEILQSIERGLSNADIAKQLGIGLYMVKEHINALFNKLGAANRTEAVAIALRKHLLKI